MPGPFQRLRRNRPLLLCALFAAAVATVIAGLGEAVRVRITEQVDENWRGAYDILVLPSDTRSSTAAAHNVVEPNFLGFTEGEGITRAQLDDIRAIADVEAAAPVAVVGVLGMEELSPVLHIASFPDEPRMYGLDLSVTSHDGLRTFNVEQSLEHIALGPFQLPEEGVPSFVATTLQAFTIQGFTESEGAIQARLPRLPVIASLVIAVDPAAEASLFASEPAALRTLATMPSGRERTAGAFDPDLVMADMPSARFRVGQVGRDVDGASRPVVPLAVADRLHGTALVTLDVRDQGALPEIPDDRGMSDAIASAAGAEPLGTATVDIAEVLRPFQTSGLQLVWPGSPEPHGQGGSVRLPQAFERQLVAPSAYREAETPLSQRPAFTLAEEQTDADFDRLLAYGGGAFRTVATRDIDVDAPGLVARPSDLPFLLTPVATFDLADFSPADDPLAYAPLGTYDPPTTTLVADPEGAELAPVELQPTFNPVGPVTPPPLAITDLEGGALLRGDTSVDAVRVRVAGLDGFDARARATVERVASEIAALGLDVEVVAGASQQEVDVRIIANDDDLGWVRQQWSTLGAATQVRDGLGTTNHLLILLALAGVAVSVGAWQVVERAVRARDLRILLSIGWTRPRVVRWSLAEAALAGLLVAVTAAAGWTIADGSSATVASLAIIALLPPVAAAFGTLAMARGTKPSDPGRARAPEWVRFVPVRGAWGYAARATASRPLRTAAFLVAGAVAGVAAGLGTAILADVSGRIGPTALAEALSASVRWQQLALVGLSLLASIVVLLTGMRRACHDRQAEFVALEGVGWSAPGVRRLLWREWALSLVPAACVAGTVVAWASTSVLAGSGTTAAALAAAAVPILVLATAPITTRVGVRGATARS